MRHTLAKDFSPAQLVLFAMLFSLILGTLSLALPWSRTQYIPFLDLLFTATSATCVTGLFTVPLDHFTTFGHVILMLLIQIGGLGLITLTLLFLYWIMDVGLSTQLLAGQVLEIDSWKNAQKIIYFIVSVTIFIELIGALVLFPAIQSESFFYRVFLALFHSISAFCNAGVTLFDQYSITGYKSNYYFLSITLLLMYLGGIGFITMREVYAHLVAKWQGNRHRLSVTTTIIVYGSTTVILSSSIIIWILEHKNVLSSYYGFGAIFNALFYAVSFKSTGFLLNPANQFQLATLLLMMILCFIGSAPGSNGSGVKITTFVIILAAIRAAITGRSSVEIESRRIPNDLLYKACAIIGFSGAWILMTIFFLLITESGWRFIDIVIEAVSAYTTLGISTGNTASLSCIGKLFIIFSMVIGRVGSYTLMLALKTKKIPGNSYSYPEERLMLG